LPRTHIASEARSVPGMEEPMAALAESGAAGGLRAGASRPGARYLQVKSQDKSAQPSLFNPAKTASSLEIPTYDTTS
jgi:hypothetical protein